ncbi:Plant self-incompatibility protein S1 family [Striga hermonthica]|uniref:S-protein homolog n=1 Tax=Striga hermonthica TaxID=68872 RepID=A0A9N7QYW5_STRHE|nr:Plant self-incompatibility protein S1 family [Striga hermonthica]
MNKMSLGTDCKGHRGMWPVILIVICSFHIIISPVEARCWFTKGYEIRIHNDMILEPFSNVKFHCASKDHKIGYHNLSWSDSGDYFSWDFCDSIWGNTLYFCRFWWGNKQVALEVFNRKIAKELVGDNYVVYYAVTSRDVEREHLDTLGPLEVFPWQ